MLTNFQIKFDHSKNFTKTFQHNDLFGVAKQKFIFQKWNCLLLKICTIWLFLFFRFYWFTHYSSFFDFTDLHNTKAKTKLSKHTTEFYPIFGDKIGKRKKWLYSFKRDRSNSSMAIIQVLLEDFMFIWNFGSHRLGSVLNAWESQPTNRARMMLLWFVLIS